MEKRPAYLGTRSDYFTHVHDLPPQLGGTPLTLSISLPHHASPAQKVLYQHDDMAFAHEPLPNMTFRARIVSKELCRVCVSWR